MVNLVPLCGLADLNEERTVVLFPSEHAITPEALDPSTFDTVIVIDSKWYGMLVVLKCHINGNPYKIAHTVFWKMQAEGESCD